MRLANEPPMQSLSAEALAAVREHFNYDAGIPLEARVVERLEEEGTRRDKVVYRGVRGFWVPAYLETPAVGGGPYPCAVLLHGWSWSKGCWYDVGNYVSGGDLRAALLAAGFAIFALDAQIHGDRIAENDYAVVNIWPGEGDLPQRNRFTLAEICEQTVRDCRRGLDWLATRPEIDSQRLGVVGYSMGAWQSFPLLAFEPRLKAGVASALPTLLRAPDPVAPQHYASGVQQPFLVQIGTEDEMATRADAEQLLALIGSAQRELRWYDGGHSLPVAYVPDAVAWLQQYV